MKKSIFRALLFAGVAMLPACTKEKGESCPAPVIEEVNYLPKNPGKSDDVTVTAKIRSEHCPFQACVVYQVARLDEEWGNTEESYRSTDPVRSAAGATYGFTATIPAVKLAGRKVHFAIEAVTQHYAYAASAPATDEVPGPIEPDPAASQGGGEVK